MSNKTDYRFDEINRAFVQVGYSDIEMSPFNDKHGTARTVPEGVCAHCGGASEGHATVAVLVGETLVMARELCPVHMDQLLQWTLEVPITFSEKHTIEDTLLAMYWSRLSAKARYDAQALNQALNQAMGYEEFFSGIRGSASPIVHDEVEIRVAREAELRHRLQEQINAVIRGMTQLPVNPELPADWEPSILTESPPAQAFSRSRRRSEEARRVENALAAAAMQAQTLPDPSANKKTFPKPKQKKGKRRR